MMLDALREFTDRLLGRGSAAITVPVMDGALKANRVLDHAEVVASLPGIDDIASDGQTLWASAGPCLYRIDGGRVIEAQRFDSYISALAVQRRDPGSILVAIALGGTRIRVLQLTGHPHEAPVELAALDSMAGVPLGSVNALSFQGNDQLDFTDGSQRNGPSAWCRDLMELGRTGRAGRWNFKTGAAIELARGLHYAYGVLTQDGATRVSESWRHRVANVAGGQASSLLAELPGYPSRMTAASGGGFWLACFVCRTQLVEFVLREPAYRARMLAAIDPRYWIAPALSSGESFLEPLQGASVKSMGVLKPWAPPRSYGLVLRVGTDGRVIRSLHSQVDGKHHGITAVAERQGRLYVASKGGGKLLAVALDAEPAP
jgi:hypothetical protein